MSEWEYNPPCAEDARQERSVRPEQSLWATVLNLAWADAFVFTDDVLASSLAANKRANGPEIVAEYIRRARRDARRFLMSDRAPYAQDRQLVTNLAGLDPEAVQSRAKETWRKLQASGTIRGIQELNKRERPHERAARLRRNIDAMAA